MRKSCGVVNRFVLCAYFLVSQKKWLPQHVVLFTYSVPAPPGPPVTPEHIYNVMPHLSMPLLCEKEYHGIFVV